MPQFDRVSGKKYQGCVIDLGVRRYAGLLSLVGREQTLLNTSPFKYMNPIPRGEKVNEPGDSTGAMRSAHPAHI